MGKMADGITGSQARSRDREDTISSLEAVSNRSLMVQETHDSSVVGPMTPLRVTIISRPDCHLCRVVYRVAEQFQQELSFDLEAVDVDGDPTAMARYSHRVPVVLIDGNETLSGKVTGGALRRAIKKARWRNPISRILSRVKLALTRG
jgi:glutaredoxin